MSIILGLVSMTRQRFDPTVLVDGEATPRTQTDSLFDGSPQPMNGKDREVFPDGARVVDMKKIYTAQGILRTVDEYDGTEADRVVLNGKTYEVIHVDDTHNVIPHDRVYILRVDPSAL